MNCQNFETVVADLARGVPLEARARVEARAHEASCARCAARLADETALSTGLRALAASAGELSAPPRVEANLLVAFRAASAERPAGREAAPAAKVVPLARPERAGRWGRVKTFGAAVAAAAAAVTLVVLVQPQKPATGERAGVRPVTSPPPRESSPRPNAPQVTAPAVMTPAVSGDTRDDVRMAAAAPAPRAANVRRVAHARPAAVRRYVRPAPAAEVGAEEIVTDFFPLTQDARLAAAEGGQVVRVELPRTALQRFGLPMNVERAGGRVKADVLLGYDGVAHAIRFVR